MQGSAFGALAATYIVTDQVLMLSKPDAEMPRFTAKKQFVHKAAKRGNGRIISLRSASLKGVGVFMG